MPARKILTAIISLVFLIKHLTHNVWAAAEPLTANECIDTAIGCFHFNSEEAIAKFILRWAIGLGGGIAFLFIIYSGFLILTSQGVPDKLKAGQELLSSAIMGLMLIIFSLFILRIIGVDLLQIPGL